ncbi:hypothetical protein GCM10009092_42900 [Bowmanella denitrificans]|uniref:Uncharacterized protein n=1 Tax=Bowmanella denitrificans TaxID=366582 RepID=A0ABN0XVM2_9ALTE
MVVEPATSKFALAVNPVPVVKLLATLTVNCDALPPLLMAAPPKLALPVIFNSQLPLLMVIESLLERVKLPHVTVLVLVFLAQPPGSEPEARLYVAAQAVEHRNR